MIAYRKWLAFGTGVGIEIGDEDLEVTITRVRPAGVSVLGSAKIADYRKRPAADWGAELNRFLRQVGAGHIAATVLLPRREVIVRHLEMPGVKDSDLASAVRFQLDGLHPFAEDEAVHSFARIKGSGTVLVGIARSEAVGKYATLFAEAGIKVTAFTFSAAAVYGALRTTVDGPRTPEFVAVHQSPAGFELYGESPSYPVFSVGFDTPNGRAVELAIAELRLAPDTAPVLLGEILPTPIVFPPGYDPKSPEYAAHALPYATAISGACPWLSLPVNLLPEAYRQTSSRLRYIPAIVLGSILGLLLLGMYVQQRVMDSRYLNLLQGEVKKYETEARRVGQVDKRITQLRARTFQLDEFKRRSRLDLDTLNELTRIMAPPGWVSNLELTRTGMRLSGETQGAAELLKLLDNSPYFQGSEFAAGINRTATGEGFQIRSNREQPQPKGKPAGAEPAKSAATGQAPAAAPAPEKQPPAAPTPEKSAPPATQAAAQAPPPELKRPVAARAPKPAPAPSRRKSNAPFEFHQRAGK
jgi:hypothetical protein